jgi:RimJ/RimL family protein N-acetyltransferase
MITLRDITDEDLPVFYAHQADPAVSAMAGFRVRDEPTFYAHWREKVLGDRATRKLAIVADGAVAGNILAFDRDGLRLVGYWLGREHWGKGIASAALAQLLELERHRPLHAWVIPSNSRSMRVLVKNGFVRGPQRVDEKGVLEVLFTLE